MNTSDNKHYSREFKIGIVQMIKEQDRSLADLADDIGVHANRLRHWIKQYDDETSDTYPGQEVIELLRLKNENKKLLAEQQTLIETISLLSKNHR